MVHWCFLSLIFSSAFFLSHRKTAGARHRLFLFLFMDKKSQQVDMVKHVYIYTYKTIANITCFFFFCGVFCDLFFFFQLVTNRAVLLNSQNSEASNGAEKNSGSMALRLHSLTSTRSKSASDAQIFLGTKSWDEDLV